MRSIKIFISGRITGLPREEALRNFGLGKDIIRKQGWDPISPLDIVPADASPREAMRICLDRVMDGQTDGILLLNDSKFSPGSHLEELTAKYCGLKIYHEEDLT